MRKDPNVAHFDWILVASSGGKDSQTMLDVVVDRATTAGVRDRVVVVHCDLARVEWTGTRDLAEAQARHYGVRFEVVSRPQGDLLTQVEKMGFWPKPDTRYCTSDHKRAQIYKMMTRLAAEFRERPGQRARPCRILNTMGFRAEESPGRKKRCAKPVFVDTKASNSRRKVTVWYPIHNWTEVEVWSRIRASGVPYHRAYDLGMKRLSCCFCIFAPEHALMIAGHHNRELLSEYVRVEAKIGHAFRMSKDGKFHLSVIQDRLEAGEVPIPTQSSDDGRWNM